MGNKTKITFSEEELRVVNDTNWILTKQAITGKIYEMFNEQVPIIRKQLDLHKGIFPNELAFALPKISRGENYRSLPYVMLDYPAVFEKDQIFAVRTMLWWGNFVSVSLLLSGSYKNHYAPAIMQSCLRSPDDLYICINNDPWEHHFEQSNYISLGLVGEKALEAIFAEKDFLKLAIKIDLALLNENGSLLEAAYCKIVSLFEED